MKVQKAKHTYDLLLPSYTFGLCQFFASTNWCEINRVQTCQRFLPKIRCQDKLRLMAATRRTFLDLTRPSRPYGNHLKKITRQEARGDRAEPVGLEVVQEMISNPLLAPTAHPCLPEVNFQPLWLCDQFFLPYISSGVTMSAVLQPRGCFALKGSRDKPCN